MNTQSVSNHGMRKTLLWMVKANAIVWLFNVATLAVLAFLGLSWKTLVATSYFPILLLLETALSLLVGGAIAFSGSVFQNKVREQFMHKKEKWSIESLKASERKANMYFALAGILFVESIVFSYLV